MTTKARWEPLDLSQLAQRLEEVKHLLEQAAAQCAAQDRSRVAAVAELVERRTREHDGHRERRRYR